MFMGLHEWLDDRFIQNEDFNPVMGNVLRCFREFDNNYNNYDQNIIRNRKYWEGTATLVGYNLVFSGIVIGGYYLVKALL